MVSSKNDKNTLPIFAYKEELIQAVSQNSVLIVIG